MVYFLSDVHLGSHYHRDPKAVEKRLSDWLYSIAPKAKSIYFLGDIFDYWFEYKYVIPRGFSRFFGALAYLADHGVELHFLAGNHDVWFNDYLTEEFGVHIHHQAIEVALDSKLFRLSHGDEETFRLKKTDRFLYKLFRNRLAWKLYGAIHPRWTVGLALGLSLKSRQKQLPLREEEHKQEAIFEVEKEPLVLFAKDYAQKHPEIDYYIFGHRHIMLDLMLKDRKRVVILGDWIAHFSFAVWDGHALLLDQLTEDL